MKRTRRSKGGFREDIGIYVRSSWEANYCRYLNWLKDNGKIRSWGYETETFPFPIKRGAIDYKPDFKVEYADRHIEYHEIKGWLDPTSKTKLKRMAKYYPEIKIRLVDAAAMRDLNALFKKMLAHWE